MDSNTAKCVIPLAIFFGVGFLGMFLQQFFKHGREKTPIPLSMQPYVVPQMEVEPKGASGGAIWAILILLMVGASIWGCNLLLFSREFAQ